MASKDVKDSADSMKRDVRSKDDALARLRAWDRQRTLSLLTLLVIGLGLFTAFRAILIAPFGLTDPGEFEYWFFIPNRDSGALSVLVAFWFMWNRRRRLSEPSSGPIGWPHFLTAGLIFPAFFWAIWVSAQALLIPTLCLTLCVIASAWGGRVALGLMIMPCAAFLLAFPPPAPLQAEIIWRLQNLTAGGADFVLSLAGFMPEREGTELRLGSHVFVIIEACSGWRGIQVLFIVALVASELRELRFGRTLWVVAAAVPLGIGLNILRASLVMLTQEELKAEFFESHTPQGMAVLVIGGVLLYAVATRLESGSDSTGPASEASHADTAEAGGPESSSPEFLRWATIGLALPLLLAGVSVATAVLREPLQPPRPVRQGFPLASKQWVGQKTPIDYFFPYSTSANPQFHAEYRKPDLRGGQKLVDLFIGWETPRPVGLDRMPDSKLLLPTNDWTLDSRESGKVWQFEIAAERAIVTRGNRSKLSYVVAWRIRDRGLFRESILSLLGLPGCGESPHGCPRVVVRVAVPIFHDDSHGRDLAREIANEFIDDFIFPLKLLAIR